MSYDIGDRVDLTGTFKVPGTGRLLDPAEVTCAVRAPDGTITTPTATRASTGVYTAFVLPDKSGEWWYAFDGTGAAQASGEQHFDVRERHVQRA